RLAKNDKLAKPAPLTRGKKGKKQKLESPPPASSPPQPVVAQKPGAPSPTPFAVASARTPPNVPNIPAVTAAPALKIPRTETAPVAQVPPAPTTMPVPVLPAQPAPAETSNVALASNAGGGSWKTFPAGKMPLGRLIGTSDLKEIADRGTAGERIYLKGQFVVNFSDANRAVLRPRGKLTDSVLHFGAAPTRIIVEFPTGYTPPAPGSTVSRDEARPLEITEVRKQEDGQLNVFAREIMQ